jgi:predicted NBD/HSP70 family sugar kinase
VRRGHSGIAGEVAHMITAGPDDAAMRFIDVFAALGLRYPESTAIDVGALDTAIGHRASGGQVLGALAGAISGVLSSVIALCDPELIVLGGPWGGRPVVVDAVRAAAVRTAAIRALGDSIVDYRRTLAPETGSSPQPAGA